MTTRRPGLGRGLSALIPEQAAPGATPRDERIPSTEVPIDSIVANPQQPRISMDPEALAELAESIREHGIIQPLLVSALEGADGEARYQLIAGERRLHAARAAGLERVPVTVRQTTPQELLELAIIENVQRADLNPLEEALAYRRLVDEFGLTQREVAERVGRSRTAVANTLRLAELPAEVRDSLSGGGITEGHARALLGLPAEVDRLAAWRAVVEQGLNVRQTEQMVRTWGRAPGAPRPAEPRSSGVPDGLVNSLQRSLGTKVSVRRAKSGRGTVTLHFYSDEELDGLLERLMGGESL